MTDQHERATPWCEGGSGTSLSHALGVPAPGPVSVTPSITLHWNETADCLMNLRRMGQNTQENKTKCGQNYKMCTCLVLHFFFLFFILYFVFVFCNIFVTGFPVKFGLLSPGRARQWRCRTYPGHWGNRTLLMVEETGVPRGNHWYVTRAEYPMPLLFWFPYTGSLSQKELNTKCASLPTNASTVVPHTTFLTYSICTLLRDLSAHPLILSPFVFPEQNWPRTAHAPFLLLPQ
jgi:hypothetical protein